MDSLINSLKEQWPVLITLAAWALQQFFQLRDQYKKRDDQLEEISKKIDYCSSQIEASAIQFNDFKDKIRPQETSDRIRALSHLIRQQTTYIEILAGKKLENINLDNLG